MAEKKPAAKAGRKTKKSDTKAKTTTTEADKTQSTATQPAPKEAETAEQTVPKATLATVTARNGVNVRTSPEKGDNIKRVLPYGAEITVQAKTTDATGTEWAQIAPKEFIMRRFLQIV